MTRQGILLRSPSSNRRMQPLLTETTGSKMVPTGEGREKNLARTKTQSFGEVAESQDTTPFEKKKQKERSLLSTSSGGSREEELQSEKKATEVVEKGKCCDHHDHNHDEETEAVDLEKQMWDQFYNTGFWRSPSQRGT
ncbi:hypothetical protein H0E87_016991 [Populus deltoides]|uniref:Uncharacterized protein n=1 Tax=Populus deltoides TaxID=3696 RepID=A0A8T2XYN6_POPDE|nr:hypothetical protein H0E87_016991 [Populus deltoides]